MKPAVGRKWALGGAIKGTYVSVEPFHLFRYMDEQTFRYNKRKGNDGMRFLEVMNQIAGGGLTYAGLTAA
jgi:hypothetical protein